MTRSILSVNENHTVHSTATVPSQSHMLFLMKRNGIALLLLVFSLGALNFINPIRIKRRVVFKQNSKFFIRLNGKTSILNATGIFAHGWAIRINYDLPDTISKMNKIFKRSLGPPDTENEIYSLASSCIYSHICKIFQSSQNNSFCGFYCDIRNKIYSSKGPKTDFLRSFLENCHSYIHDGCPMESGSFDNYY